MTNASRVASSIFPSAPFPSACCFAATCRTVSASHLPFGTPPARPWTIRIERASESFAASNLTAASWSFAADRTPAGTAVAFFGPALLAAASCFLISPTIVL